MIRRALFVVAALVCSADPASAQSVDAGVEFARPASRLGFVHAGTDSAYSLGYSLGAGPRIAIGTSRDRRLRVAASSALFFTSVQRRDVSGEESCGENCTKTGIKASDEGKLWLGQFTVGAQLRMVKVGNSALWVEGGMARLIPFRFQDDYRPPIATVLEELKGRNAVHGALGLVLPRSLTARAGVNLRSGELIGMGNLPQGSGVAYDFFFGVSYTIFGRAGQGFQNLSPSRSPF